MIKFFKKSFKRELFLSFVAVSCVPLVITGLSLVYVFKNWVMHNEEKEAEQQLQQMESSIVAALNQIEETTQHIMANHLILLGTQKQNSMVRNRAYKQFYIETQNLRQIAQVNIYDAKGICQFSTTAQEHTENMLTYWGILKRAQAKPQKMLFEKAYPLHTDSTVYLQGAQAINNEQDECIGFIVVSITSDGFKTILQNTYNEQNSIAILDKFLEEVYSTKKGQVISEALRSMYLNQGDTGEKLKDMDYFIKPIKEADLYVILYKYSTFTEGFTGKMRLVIAIMTMVSILWCILTVDILSAFITKPIKKLTYAMHEVENGNLAYKMESHRADEIGQLSRSFDKMTRELEQNIKLQIEQQKKLNESHVALMQAQLNPHFLYNTLDTMKWVAKANHIPEMVILASGLAKILRTSISGERFITLSQELGLIEAYVEIQKIRFSGKFSYDIEIEPELEECMVPKLVLQPIVENAVIHGLKESEYGQIFINIYKQKEDMAIDVYDDGCGMEDETLEALNSQDEKKLKGHIGFYNVATIIRLNYGEAYGVKAERQQTGGTKIHMVLPIKRRGEQDNV